MADRRDRDQQTESRRILERVSHEAESGGPTVIGRAARRARKHLVATDVDPGDWAEYWGTRIGRTVGAVIVVGLVVWLLIFLVRVE